MLQGQSSHGQGCEGSGRTQAPHVRRESAVVAGRGGLRAQGPYSKGNIRGTPREEDVRHTGGREDAGSPPPWAGRGFRRQPSDQGGAGRCGRGRRASGKEKAAGRTSSREGPQARPGHPRTPCLRRQPPQAPESLGPDRRLGSRPVCVWGFFFRCDPESKHLFLRAGGCRGG